MEIKQLHLHEKREDSRHYALAIGFFDGVHLGHQALINRVTQIAKQKHLVPAVMTFDVHPMTVLKGEKSRHLMSKKDRAQVLEAMGIEMIFEIVFSKEVAQLSPKSFIEEYIISNHVDHVVVGYDFRFGDHNSGHVRDLKGYPFTLDVVKAVMYDDTYKVSSTLIKKFLDEGEIHEANALLGRHFTITGEVVHGKHRGSKMGFPTANVDYDDYYLPMRGVYGVKVYINDHIYLGMANIGRNPTFKDIYKDTLEINIFDFDQDIYGSIISVEFCVFERGEHMFKSVDDLISQLHHDQKTVRQMLLDYNQEKTLTNKGKSI